MEKKFILKNRNNEEIGEVIFSENNFQVNVESEEKQIELEALLNFFVEQGISDLGEIILENPIKLDDPLFFDEIKNQLARKGYILIEKEQ